MTNDVTWGCDAAPDKQIALAHAVRETLMMIHNDLKEMTIGGEGNRNAMFADAATLGSTEAIWSAHLFGVLGIVNEKILLTNIDKGNYPKGELCVLYCAAKQMYRKAYDDGFRAAMSMWGTEKKETA